VCEKIFHRRHGSISVRLIRADVKVTQNSILASYIFTHQVGNLRYNYIIPSSKNYCALALASKLPVARISYIINAQSKIEIGIMYC
jgi:hypothetical protein